MKNNNKSETCEVLSDIIASEGSTFEQLKPIASKSVLKAEQNIITRRQNLFNRTCSPK